MKPYFNLIGNSQCQNSKATLIKEKDNKCCSYTEVCPLFLAGELQIPLPTGQMIEKSGTLSGKCSTEYNNGTILNAHKFQNLLLGLQPLVKLDQILHQHLGLQPLVKLDQILHQHLGLQPLVKLDQILHQHLGLL